MHCALPRQDGAPAVDEGATQCAGIETHRDLIGETCENTALD